MRLNSGLVLGAMLVASLICAESPTRVNTDNASAVIDMAVESHGRGAAIDSVENHVALIGHN